MATPTGDIIQVRGSTTSMRALQAREISMGDSNLQGTEARDIEIGAKPEST